MPRLNPDYDPMDPTSGSVFLDGAAEGSVSWGDRGRALASGALDTGAEIASGARALQDTAGMKGSSELSQFFSDSLKRASERTQEGMSPTARELLHSTLTSPEFWEHPINGAGLKALNMAPGVAASIAPAVLTDGAITPWLVAGAGGVLGGAASADDTYAQIDHKSDQELQADVPYYAQMRAQGVPEDRARADTATKLMGLKPLLNGAAGAAAMALGPAGRLAGLIPEDIAAALMKRVGVGAGEGALGGALMGTAAEGTHEQTEVDLGDRSALDLGKIAAAGGDQALTLGAMGGVGGAFTGGHGRAPEARNDGIQQVDAKGPDAAQDAALKANQPAKPMTDAPVTDAGNPATGEADARVPSLPGDSGGNGPPGDEGVLAPEPAAPVLSEDAGKTVPEAPATLEAQQEQLVSGQRRAMLFPKAKKGQPNTELPLPEGMKKTVTKDGTWHFNPEHIKQKDIYEAAKNKRLNEILDLGDYSKKDLEPRVAAGEPAVAVTERAPDGTEVKAAAGTEGTAPEQVASLEEMKTPGNTVQVETPQDVIADRVAAPRVLKDVAEPVAPKVEAPKAETADEKTARLRAARLARDAAAPAAEAPKAEANSSELAAGIEQPKAEIVPHKELHELPPEVMAQIAHRLESIWQAAEAQERNGMPMKGGIEPFIARKREQLIAEARAAGQELSAGVEEPAPPRARAQAKNEGKHFTRKQKVEREQNNATAEGVVKRFAPSEEERANSSGPKGRDMMLKRAQEMVEAAQREGVKIPTKLKDATDQSMEHGNAVALLVEAKDLLRTRSGGPGLEDVMRFLQREYRLRSGEKKDLREVMSERRAEGEQKMSVRRGNAEETASPDAEVEAERVRVESIADEAPNAEERGLFETDEPRQAPTNEKEPRERPTVELKGDEVTAAKDSTGTFKSEVKRKRTRTDRALEEGDPTPEEILAAFHDEKVPSDPETGHYKVDAHLTMDLGEALSISRKNLETSGVPKYVQQHVIDRLSSLVKDVPVHLISEKEMKRIQMRGENERGSWGLFSFDTAFKNKGAIFISEKTLERGPQWYHETVIHEALHAALSHVIEKSTYHYNTIRMMAAETAKFLGEDMNNPMTYALTNAHEFMSEALSNSKFTNETLAKITVSPELRDRLQLKSKTNLRNGFMGFIRKVLGLGKNKDTFTMLEAVIRHGDRMLRDSEKIERPYDAPGTVEHGRANYLSERAINDVNDLFREPFARSLDRGRDAGVDFIRQVTEPGKLLASTIQGARNTGGVLRKMLLKVTTNDQYVNNPKIRSLLPMGRDITDNIERAGVLANKLKEDGLDLAGAMMRAQKANPGLFDKFAQLVHAQTMVGAEASSELGVNRNAHLGLSKQIQDKLTKGTPLSDLESETAMRAWEGRAAHADLVRRYKEIIKQDPQYAGLQEKLFKHYDDAQGAMVKGQIDSILRTYDFKGTAEERMAMAEQLYQGKMAPEIRAALEGNIGEQAVKQIENVQALKVVNGPYAALMRRGEHAILGEYKIEEPTNGIKIDDDTWEFKTREEARAFAVKSGLHPEVNTAWYDTATGLKVKRKADAISTGGDPEQRFHVRLQRHHLEFHEDINDARARLKELEASGLMDKVGLEERRHIESDQSQFTTRGVDSLLKSLANQENYRNASEHERTAMRQTIREAGLRSLSDNRVQSRRLPRRFVKGASDDVIRNLYDYTNSQANYRARMHYRDAIDSGLKAMWDHVEAGRYTPDNEARSMAANEIERRVRAPDPNEYSGAYTEWTRRVSTWSYIDRMMRPSHLILHQTHLPMITAPYMAGRHGVVSSYGAIMKAWKDLTGFYGAGGHDAWAATWGSALQKGANYSELGKQALSKSPDFARLSKMLDYHDELGIIHPSAGIEVQKYMPSRQMGGPLGAMDRTINKLDTVFRHLTNSTEAINRIGGAVAAYRLEFSRLTRAGKSEAEAHQGAVEYSRLVLTDTQGLYSATNAAPIFKNRFLKPFLQFKQFPQMMYHLLGKLMIQSYKGETREAKIQAMASLAAILGMHSMMAGVIQGVPLEPFKLLGLVSKGIGLTDSDWTDVEQAERRAIKSTLGDDVGNLVINGVGSQLAGVDVHHRLGLNSFVTFGMPDQMDSKSVSEFVVNTVAGAPGGLVADTLKGVHKMLSGDIEGGAFQAVPLQALRDARNAINPPANKYGYTPTGADRVKSALGFTPAAKAHAAEAKEAVYNATHSYDAERTKLTKQWVDAPNKAEVWDQIVQWNAGKHGAAKLTKGDLFKSLHRANSVISHNRSIAGVKTTAHNKGIAESMLDLYH